MVSSTSMKGEEDWLLDRLAGDLPGDNLRGDLICSWSPRSWSWRSLKSTGQCGWWLGPGAQCVEWFLGVYRGQQRQGVIGRRFAFGVAEKRRVPSLERFV